MLPLLQLALAQDNDEGGDWDGTERLMSTNGCLNLGSGSYVTFEAGAYWTGAEVEEPEEVSLEDVEFPEDGMDIGGRNVDISAVFEVDNENYLSFKIGNDDENGQFSVMDKMAMCGWLADQCTTLVPAWEEEVVTTMAPDEDEDEDAEDDPERRRQSSEDPVCVWTLKQEENNGDWSCMLAFQYESMVDDFTVTDCGEIMDEEEEEDGEDEQAERRRGADQFENCDASYYRGMMVGEGLSSSCSMADSDCTGNSVTVSASDETMLTYISAGSELVFNMDGAGSGDGSGDVYDAIYQMYSIEACDTCEENQADGGYDRMMITSSNVGVSIHPLQSGYMCLVPYLEEGGLQCDNRQVFAVTPCDTQATLKITMSEDVNPGAVLNVLKSMADDEGMDFELAVLGESLGDVLPSYAEDEEEVVTTMAPDDEEEEEDGEEENRRLERRRTESELEFALSGAESVAAVKNLYTLNALNDALSEAGLPEAEWVYTVEEDDGSGLSDDSLLLNDMFILVMAIGFLIAAIAIFQAFRMCSPKDEGAGDKKALMTDQTPNQYGGAEQA